MGTKNYDKGYGCVGFDFRRFLVKGLRDSKLGRRGSKFIGKMANGKETWKLFWNFRKWKRSGKCLGRF